MNLAPLKIVRIDSRQSDAGAAVARLREALSPRGNVVSDAGRLRTIEVFGEPLTPLQVVERICGDVRRRGLAAVVDYSARIDKAQLTAQTLRVAPEELSGAHAQADRGFLATIRRIRENILEFQRAVIPCDVTIERGDGC